MFHFKLLFVFLFLGAALICQAQTASTSTASARVPPRLIYWSASIFVVSWQEQVKLQNGNVKDSAYANFYGNSFNLIRKSYFRAHPHHGTILDIGVLYGTTALGGTQPVLVYQASNLTWSGASLSYLYAYRSNTSLALSIGPELLYRQITYAPIGGTTATSGANLNYGLIAEMKEQLTDHLELQQSLGGLAVNASTLWSVGLGYVF